MPKIDPALAPLAAERAHMRDTTKQVLASVTQAAAQTASSFGGGGREFAARTKVVDHFVSEIRALEERFRVEIDALPPAGQS